MGIDKETIIKIVVGVGISTCSILVILLLAFAVFVYYFVNKVEDNNKSGENYIIIEGEDNPSIPDSEKVVVYGEDANGKKLASFLSGKYILTQNTDNKIMSLKVPTGYEVHLYDDNNFKKELAVYRMDIILPIDLRNKTSSIIVNKVA